TDGTDDVLGADGAAPGGAVTGVATGSNVANPVSGNLGGAGIAGQYGTLVLNADGTYTYTLTKTFDGATADNGITTEQDKDSFTYTVTDAHGNTTTGTILVDIVDDVPTAHADTNSVAEGAQVSGNVLTDGTD
ncbi:structural toxin protein RtxA, partial [Mesorhizobium sp. M3A.F.Ca.ET.175.01.1.1]|uniref:Ig-like domain-containing protein n=1 Tax=Mesorhizobium sp. M3A.F.Ca.ET.175.01.1.1 TaxID=2563945 RepID=UPI0011337ADB